MAQPAPKRAVGSHRYHVHPAHEHPSAHTARYRSAPPPDPPGREPAQPQPVCPPPAHQRPAQNLTCAHHHASPSAPACPPPCPRTSPYLRRGSAPHLLAQPLNPRPGGQTPTVPLVSQNAAPPQHAPPPAQPIEATPQHPQETAQPPPKAQRPRPVAKHRPPASSNAYKPPYTSPNLHPGSPPQLPQEKRHRNPQYPAKI